MSTSRVYFRSGAFGNWSVQVDGLESLVKWMGSADPKLQRALKRGLKDAMSPVLQRARANASKIADDGTFGDSLSIASRKGGSLYLLKSSGDDAAGVKEFAHLGARYATKPTDRRINARKMSTFPVGVPRRAYAPRVMVPAVDDSLDEVEAAVASRIDEVLGEVENG